MPKAKVTRNSLQEPYPGGKWCRKIPDFVPIDAIPPLPRLDSAKVRVLDTLTSQVHLRDESRRGALVLKIHLESKVYTGVAVMKLFHLYSTHSLLQREINAFTRLHHFGVCDKAFVPKVYGVYEIPGNWQDLHIEDHLLLSYLSDRSRCKGQAPTAIFMEYLPDATPITPLNLTESIADDLLRGLDAIHNSGVVHGDSHPRNFLLSKGQRAVWIDFDHSETHDGPMQACLLHTERRSVLWTLRVSMMRDGAYMRCGKAPRDEEIWWNGDVEYRPKNSVPQPTDAQWLDDLRRCEDFQHEETHLCAELDVMGAQRYLSERLFKKYIDGVNADYLDRKLTRRKPKDLFEPLLKTKSRPKRSIPNRGATRVTSNNICNTERLEIAV